MKTKALGNDSGDQVLVFDKGEEVMAALTAFVTRQGIAAAHFTAIGALSDVVLGYFDRARKDYKKIPVPQQVEVLSLVGDVALDGDKPKIHAHIVVGDAEGHAFGGHLLEGHVWPTLELILTPSPQLLRRRMDPETGLALLDPAA